MKSLPADYFSVFGISPQLALDLPELQRQFYVLSKQHHPDRFARASTEQQRYALDFTSLLNDAWRVFRDPVARAEYLLKLKGYDTPDGRSNDGRASSVPTELLEEVFELNMALEEARDGDSNAKHQVAEALKHFTALRESLDRERDQIFAAYDSSKQEFHLDALRSLLHRRRYIDNLVRDAQQALS